MRTDAAAAIIDGKAIAARLREEMAGEARRLAERLGRPPGLAVIRVGDDPASEVYVRNKRRAAEKAGVRSWEYHMPADTPREALLDKIAELNADGAVDGILVQLPLPGHLDEDEVVAAVSPEKDVDGFHAHNVGRLWQGRPGLVPSPPL
ncbi:MAG: tetrahydrofolate dehydrogenase/cyclohydrolase catalytic domain-containing protein, partial [Limnochordales bacterium]